MKFPSLANCLLSLLLAVGPCAGVHAQERPARSGMSLDQAVAMVESRYGGRVVKAERKGEGERAAYRIRVLTEDGRVLDLRVDPASGRIR
ncbi:MAG: PepSY domain-containing protein [Steroidobacteraceae bacterium]